MITFRSKFILIFLILLQQNLWAQKDYMVQWPSFRGPYASGILDIGNTPISWDIEKRTNILWKTPIPGLGHSCPVIWNEKLFVTTAISGNEDEYLKVGLYGNIDAVHDSTIHKYKVYCLDKYTGEILWEQLAHEGVPKTKRHTKGSHANSTPATDGEHLVVSFGSEGLYCYDLNGNLLWEKDLGNLNAGPFTDPDFEWGYAASPIIHKNRVVLQCDVLEGCFLATFDILTGEEIWRVNRDEVSTWCTPTIYETDSLTMIIVNGFQHIGGYDFETGEEIWRLHGGGDAPVPTPVVADDLIYINNAHGKMSPIYVIKPGAMGDITLEEDSLTNEFIVWSIIRGGAYMQTPLIYEGYLYNLRGNGLLTCFDAKTGEIKYKEPLRPEGGITASAIASDGKLYFSTELGDVYVVKAGAVFEMLAKNPMNDVIMATPALSEGAIYFRTQHFVVAVFDDKLPDDN